MTVEIVNAQNGGVSATSGTVTVQPGIVASAFGIPSIHSYCRVSGISKKSVTVTFYAMSASNVMVGMVTAP